jgi:hypothetical protein
MAGVLEAGPGGPTLPLLGAQYRVGVAGPIAPTAIARAHVEALVAVAQQLELLPVSPLVESHM